MAYLGDPIDAQLAAVAGSDPALFVELRSAFLDSAQRQLDLMRRSRCDGNWSMAGMRLKGLAASFHAEGLMALAEQALAGAPGDPAVLRRIAAWLDDFRAGPDILPEGGQPA
ncbi:MULTISPECIES: Hpt domain-containing protein [unclassified Novosphingobium]|uniref:Hpt domain-containing protein n=1 Tax=unclassified Novosphingobium TaxID=2644732 RepID=UPI00146F4A85|nr:MULTISPECIES: Hpt domain-containing protein [unclassified Novosphingobium]NMN03996.1 HPt (histidine-containing phosphotransfer) domain-containing protein [Novosphingobium sp. SG919]NMN86014.1 HPt (histidine-containing phosphotransfer) domain-containing protein [Novosphingobium sp. SG916]